MPGRPKLVVVNKCGENYFTELLTVKGIIWIRGVCVNKISNVVQFACTFM